MTKFISLMGNRKPWSRHHKYLNNSINEEIHAQSPYRNHGTPETSNEENMIYSGVSADGLVQRNSGERLMIELAKQGDSYHGVFNIVLNSVKKD